VFQVICIAVIVGIAGFPIVSVKFFQLGEKTVDFLQVPCVLVRLLQQKHLPVEIGEKKRVQVNQHHIHLNVKKHL
jgi:hypothetical protein